SPSLTQAPRDAPRTPREGRRPDGDESGRGAKAHDAAEGRGEPEGASEIRALREGPHTRRERDRGAAARPAAREGRVPGIARRTEDRVERVRAGAELGRVGLAEDDRARRLEPLDDQGVPIGDAVLEDLRALRGADPL